MIVVLWAYVGGLSGLDHCHRQYRQRQSTNTKNGNRKKTNAVDDCCFVGLRGRPVGPQPLPPPIPTTRINQQQKRKKKKDERQWMIVVSWAYVGGLSGLDHCHRQYRQRESTNNDKRKKKKDERQWMIVVSWAYVGGLSGLDHCHRRYRQRQSTNTKKGNRKKTNDSG